MAKISDYNVYTTSMAKGMVDKLFFIDKITDVSTILDYGCADGSLIKTMANLFPEYNYYGYDIDKKMVDLANSNNKNLNVSFTGDKEKLLSSINPKETLINLSSVLHEIYSYGNEESINEFWDIVLNTGYRYITIRDMGITREDAMRESNKIDVVKIRQLANLDRLDDFETRHGNINMQQHLLHFLQKYRYTANWTREVDENYYSIYIDDLLRTIPFDYEIVYYDYYTLPFLQHRVKEDFGIELKNSTHYKLIIKKK